MKKFFTLLGFLLGCLMLGAQSPGDTIRVKVFDFNSTNRDTAVVFPTDPDISFEKIVLKYTMRCDDGLVNNGNSRGCHRWDFSCNTYLVDSTKIEAELNSTPSHLITNFEGSVFPYLATPSYNYLRGTQSEVEIINTANETAAAIGTGTIGIENSLSTQKLAGKSHYLYTAAELTATGFTPGNIEALSLNILAAAGEAKFMKINIKPTSKTVLDGFIDTDGFTEVYYKNTTFAANETNRFNFHTPFAWDGSSNLIVEFNFTNVDATTNAATMVEGASTTTNMGLSSTNESEIMVTNNTYLECNDYTGILGSQNRTVEAWIRATNAGSAEIISWGVLGAGRKWVMRFQDGKVRLENQNGGTVSTTTVNDGEWHHVACVLDGTTLADISFYIDGVLDVNSAVGTSAMDTRPSPVRINRGLNNRYMEGSVDEVRIWSTNLSGATIAEWKGLKLDSTHPNYENLELYYPFDEAGDQVIDASVNGRNATIIGSEYKVAHLDGATLFKDFTLQASRPNLTFYQGDYTTEVNTTIVDKPIEKELRHFVVANSIDSADPATPVHDLIVNAVPIQYWSLNEKIFDEATGALIEENTLIADGEVEIGTLEYFRRFPFYNELVSFVTPYGINLDLGLEGQSWFMDMSDYVSILKNNKRVQMTLGGQFNEEIDMEFLFIVGTPPREVIQYEQIWQGTNRTGIARIDEILDDSKLAPIGVPLAATANSFKLKSSITGHGMEGEFGQNGGSIDHKISVDQTEIFNWDITQECSFNPIYPQGGTWVFNRQGWCPGEQTFMNEQDLTDFVSPGGMLNIDYSTSAPLNANGDYRYHIAHQLVGYGPANFQLDAAVTNVIAPNNSAEFRRVGTICKEPSIVIKNTGATTLTQLTINYWLNDSQNPQTYEWTGSLDFMEEEVVVIPSEPALWYDILDENNVFHAEIASPNQGADAYSFNNKISSSFDFPDILPNMLSVEFRTNNIPAQNSFQLFDATGAVVGGNTLPSANTTYTDDFELGNGCYKLIVEDTGGDGLQFFANTAQGNGFVRIVDGDGFSVKTFVSDFGGGFEFNFSTSFPVSVEDLEFLTSIKVFPNPANTHCSLEADDLLGAEVYLVDLLGRTVPANINSRSENLITLDVAHLDAGIYFMVITKEEVVTTRKVIIE